MGIETTAAAIPCSVSFSRRLLREKLHKFLQILREGVSTRRLRREQRQRHLNSPPRRFLRRRVGFPAHHPEARGQSRENGAGRSGGPTGRRSQPRPPRGTSKPWVQVTTPRPTQGRALKERRSGCERACAVHGCLARGTRSPAPIQGATLVQGRRRAGFPGQHSPRLGPPLV